MISPEWWDHAVVAALLAVVPLRGAWEYRRLASRVSAGVPDARNRQYRSTMIMQWGVAACIVILWAASDRPADLLGFALPGGMQLNAGLTIAVFGLAFLYSQWRGVRKLDNKGLEPLRKQMNAFAAFLPHTSKEAGLFRWLSVTAGICEEIVYRGYLIWYLAAFVGEWPAAVIAGAAFGVFHLYQGLTGVLKTGAVGLLMGLLYVGTGSLVWPMILHSAIDLQGGAVARHVLTSSELNPDS
ncbi:MAG TPA: CPBP family intramembrane glutamic endopeptidase [Rhodothermales bacterium]|nr:CPBP family intramembrane glutamic endopeptidase [Rhodothermales bacterium]